MPVWLAASVCSWLAALTEPPLDCSLHIQGNRPATSNNSLSSLFQKGETDDASVAITGATITRPCIFLLGTVLYHLAGKQGRAPTAKGAKCVSKNSTGANRAPLLRLVALGNEAVLGQHEGSDASNKISSQACNLRLVVDLGRRLHLVEWYASWNSACAG